ncbi:MAG: HD domain-containing protein [Bacteroidales bacterium]|nr:HD domain-containing protein [Bacteroidales bacterium]
MKQLIQALLDYLENEILPLYDAFDKGHQRDHAHYVMDTALRLSEFYDVDKELIITAAAYHDLGLSEDRATHHLISGRIIRSDQNLRRWFTEEQIESIAQAAEDHRASSDHEPRTIYGKIIAEADRQIIPETVIRRTVQFGLSHYPELDKEGHWQRMLEHLHDKYAEGGYLKLWIPESPNAERLMELRDIIRDTKTLRRIFDATFEQSSPPVPVQLFLF